ncbi:MBL fold metallo-hydrolase [Pseudalkalibacillus salsuginis]|uniref:MBL fold metallo-hydrolase n=1 Tax=Pseudalkalibacillus salsuginis TaxID=2910972 RepID=UPI001F3B246E|nr:MBL fold metallo-hydrolase [Pseudalkalibacillus salsuginis]MCF6411658.1 MBL fold metallo-hydrolase [Pseudalkalibacillus salsuginis]
MNEEVRDAFLPLTSVSSGKGSLVIPDVYSYTNQIVNLFFVMNKSDDWVLVDAGMPKSKEKIIEAVEKQFGQNHPPKAVILTHGHFDHVGSVEELAIYWEVPVYAHPLEFPYLTGEEDYPKGNPEVDGGMVSEMSPLFPNHSIDIQEVLNELPADGSIPDLPEWKWVHTPGHTPGHISLFRESDRALIAGDAFVTVDQESLYNVYTQKKEINGPPAYFTMDWNQAENSVKVLEQLKPSVAITGHGVPMSGNQLQNELLYLVNHFDEVAVPKIYQNKGNESD